MSETDAQPEKHDEYLKSDAERLAELGRGVLGCFAPKEYQKEMFECLEQLRRDTESREGASLYAAEINILTGAAQFMEDAKLVVPYKAHDPRTEAGALTPDMIEKQKGIRKNLTEWTSLLRWHLLQNRNDRQYLEGFFNVLHGIWEAGDWVKDGDGVERGVFAELGAMRVLEKYCKVEVAHPAEDGFYGIDFWAQTKSGRHLIIQTKSSAIFQREGLYDQRDVEEFLERKKRATGAGQRNTNEEKRTARNINEAKKLIGDFEIAKAYAREKRGLPSAEPYLVVLPANFVERPTGEPQWENIKELEAKVATVADT